MSAHCKICGAPIEDGTVCAGFELPGGRWVCDTIDCAEFAIAVVAAARAVVKQFDGVALYPTRGIRLAVGRLREALADA